MRNRAELSQVAQDSFEPERIAVTRGKRLLLCISTARRLWRSRESAVSQAKDAERRDKVSAGAGKDTRSRQDP
jgi:hypothetical protein